MYGINRDELLVLRKIFTNLLDKEFIRISNFAAAAPVLLARKPGGSVRFCVDYRAFNKIIIKNRYPLPLISKTLRNIAKAKWYTKLDIIAAFHQMRITKGEKWKTAFRTRFGLYEWNVMPFRLSNALLAFQRYINWVLRDILDDFVIAYADDILIYSSNSLEDHRQKIQNVLQKLVNAELQADIQKSEFQTYEIKYLGHIINSEKGILMNSEKIRAIKNWAVPTNVKAVRSFIGFANFYRMFIPTYSDIIRLFVDLTKKNKEFHWNEKCNEAFEKLKELIITGLILAHFHPERKTILEADSLGYATGGLLLQKNEKG
jgi:hypothetical protein